jgi:hypothetical protein
LSGSYSQKCPVDLTINRAFPFLGLQIADFVV